MSETAECRVTVDEVAKVRKMKPDAVRAECVELGVWVGADWAGRPAVSEFDARSLVDGSARRKIEHDRNWQQHLADSEAWAQERAGVVAEAGREAEAETRRKHGSSVSSAMIADARRDAMIAAGKRYERQNGRPLFQERVTNTVPLKYVSPAEEGRGQMVGAVIGAVRGGVA